MKNGSFPWKQHYLRVPEKLKTKIDGFKNNEVVVGCVRRIPYSEVEAGAFRHLQIGASPQGIFFKEVLVPPREVGRYSTVNLDGKEVVRRDLPKVWKTFTLETPNWGDSYYGYHDVDIDRLVYKREFISPRELSLRFSLVGEEPAPQRRAVFKITVDTILDRKSGDFEEELLFAVNLLQENIGAVDVFPADASNEDYLRTVYVDWEILPPGEREQNIARILSGFRASSAKDREKVIERYDFMAKLNPIVFIAGRSGFRRYFGAQFEKNLIAFENVEYGNAIYVMFEEWEKLSQRSRIELLSGDRDGFVRIVHGKGWKDQLKEAIKRHRAVK